MSSSTDLLNPCRQIHAHERQDALFTHQDIALKDIALHMRKQSQQHSYTALDAFAVARSLRRRLS